MKKILLLLLPLAMMPLYNKLKAQCAISNVIVRVNSATPSGNNMCTVNFDYTFTMEHNNGNKFIYMHVWLAGSYPNFFNVPPNPNLAKPPMAADLINSVINIGINNDINVTHPAPTLLQVYSPDPTVVLSTASSVIENNGPTGDWFTIKGIEVTLPLGCGNIINLIADFWSSNSSAGQNAQCIYGNQAFIIDPRINGFINCTLPRTYNVIISSVATTPISGEYSLYLDYPSNPAQSGTIGTFDPNDVLIGSTNYTTSINGGINSYVQSNVGYLPYSNQKPDADRNLWVIVSAVGYPNKAMNLLVNACAPLDLKLLSFEAAKVNGQVTLQWKTEQELNMSGFSIERKYGSGQFQELGFVPAKSEQNNEGGAFMYSFTDNAVTPGVVAFYRLKMIEKEGTFTYSDIKAIRNEGSKLFVTVHPNPNAGAFNVAVPSDAGIYDLILTDYCGKVLKTMNGVRNQSVQINNLSPGIYLLKMNFREKGGSLTEKVIVQ